LSFDVKYDSITQGTISLDFPGSASVRISSGLSVSRDLSDLTAGIVYVLTDYLPSIIRRFRARQSPTPSASIEASAQNETCVLDPFEACVSKVEKMQSDNRSALGFICGTRDGRFDVKYRAPARSSSSPQEDDRPIVGDRLCFDHYEATCRSRAKVRTAKKKQCPTGASACDDDRASCCCLLNHAPAANGTRCDARSECPPLTSKECVAVAVASERSGYRCVPETFCKHPTFSSEAGHAAEKEKKGEGFFTKAISGVTTAVANVAKDTAALVNEKLRHECELRDETPADVNVAATVRVCGEVESVGVDDVTIREDSDMVTSKRSLRTIPLTLPSLVKDVLLPPLPLTDAACGGGESHLVLSVFDCAAIVESAGTGAAPSGHTDGNRARFRGDRSGALEPGKY